MKHLDDLARATPVKRVTPGAFRFTRVTADEAEALQARVAKAKSGRLEWCVHIDPPEFPGQVVAKPWFIPADPSRRGQSAMIGAFLVADTLRDLRAKLPPRLRRTVPEGVTDPTVAEVWK